MGVYDRSCMADSEQFAVLTAIVNGQFPKTIDRSGGAVLSGAICEGESGGKNILIERNLRLVAHIIALYPADLIYHIQL